LLVSSRVQMVELATVDVSTPQGQFEAGELMSFIADTSEKGIVALEGVERGIIPDGLGEDTKNYFSEQRGFILSSQERRSASRREAAELLARLTNLILGYRELLATLGMEFPPFAP